MLRRLYFLLPDEHLTKHVVDELIDSGIKIKQIHALQRITPSNPQLPDATPWQKLDMAQKLENVIWNSNLVMFALALLVLMIALLTQLYTLAFASFIVMVVTFVLGDLFATFMPRVHLREFEDALSHGEVLLMIDVPSQQVAEIEARVLHHHPAAIPGGASWTIQLNGL